MPETLRLLLTNFTDETIMISSMIMLIVFCSLVFYWLYNRKKYRELTHQIPAAVVKSYLDSIIQNSTSLKSQLFRGGGLEIGDGIPSVFPTKDFPTSNIEVTAGNSEELSRKNAEIASLNARLSDKDGIISDLEKRLNDTSSGSGDNDEAANILRGELEAAQARIIELEAELEALRNAAPEPVEGGASAAELDEVKVERDELKQRLAEYEVLEDDIADLKKFKQENEQLKKSLAAYEGGAAPEPAAEEPAFEPAPEPEAPAEAIIEDEAPVEEAPADDAEDLEAQMAAAIGTPEEPEAAAEAPAEEGGEEKNQELLSEFEKMLG